MIIVTGCAGFIGWKVTELLLDAGHQVLGIDNLAPTYDTRLKHWRLAQLEERPGFRFHHVDICHRDALHDLFRKAPLGSGDQQDAVVHLAARAGVRSSVEDPWAYYETNVMGALNTLWLCQTYGVKRFVLASTSSLYGDAGRHPALEEAPTDRPLSPYAASKKAAEALAYAYHHLHGLNVTVLRYFTVYGPAGRPDMSIFRFIRAISEGKPLTLYGDGSQKRDFTYVDDIARGTILGLQPPGFHVINLGSDRPVAVQDVIRLLEQEIGQPAHIERRPVHSADVAATWANVTRAREILGWQPQVLLEEGLRRAVAWYRANRSWARDIQG